jgi:hypothetical protein
LTKINIPEGTKIEKTISGGDAALNRTADLLKENSFDGYVKVKLKSGRDTITSYMVIKDSEPRLGVREILTRDDKDPKKKRRKVFAGKNTLKDVRKDISNEKSKVELHSGVDIDEILSSYSKGKTEAKPVKTPEVKEKKVEKKVDKKGEKKTIRKEGRKIGLVWGTKEKEDVAERKALEGKMRNWKADGFDITGLEDALSKGKDEAIKAFEQYERDIEKLEEIAAELELLLLAGFEEEVGELKGMLKQPNQIPYIRERIEALENMMGEGRHRDFSVMKPRSRPHIIRSKTEAPAPKKTKKETVDTTPTKTCLVCGYRLTTESSCPRCGTQVDSGTIIERYIPKEVEPAVEDEPDSHGEPGDMKKGEAIILLDGHCYIIIEEKLKRSLKVFSDTLSKGYKGFCITRTNPRHLRGIKGFQDATVMWLTDKESTSGSTISPVLERIMYEIGDFIRHDEKRCLILDGIEYLISNNNFDAVLRFIRRLVDDVSESKTIFMITVSPFTLKNQELKILEREMETISLG